MGQSTVVGEVVGPQVGETIPDFFGRAADGRMVYRREYKGRRHLVLCFAAPLAASMRRTLLDELAARHPALLAADAAAVLFLDDATAAPDASPYLALTDTKGRMHARYGATASPLLLVADRYGEVVVRRTLDDIPAALDEALAATEWLQTRCSV